MLTKQLINQFNTQTPRYTSYPTVPAWTSSIGPGDYQQILTRYSQSDRPLSIYIHLPFCEKMCYYCGCNVVIKKTRREIGDTYLDYLENEVRLLTSFLNARPPVLQLHFGGGTPNYLSNSQISRLFVILHRAFEILPSAEISIEIDPRTITHEQIRHYPTLGINRLSMGIQDFDPSVQVAVNRVQSLDSVMRIFDWARSASIDSINIDLIYGLPLQTRHSFLNTMTAVNQLSPDRIALYSYAHVPWLKSHQRLINESDLPSPEDKVDIFLMARDYLLSHDYDAIGMDHFARSNDELSRAYSNGTLYRNFMGYTTKPADDYIGLGVSSIGFLNNLYIQNTPDLDTYYQSLDSNQLPTYRGFQLSQDDIIRHAVINTLMCQFKLDKHTFNNQWRISFDDYFSSCLDELSYYSDTGLIEIKPGSLFITDLGRLFIRNIVHCFDNTSPRPNNQSMFSKAI